MKPHPIFALGADTFVRHFGNMAGSWIWAVAWPDGDAHWWCARIWWKE